MVLYVVGSDEAAEFKSIGAALAQAGAGDTVELQPGTYTELVHVRHDICIRPTRPSDESEDGQAVCLIVGNVIVSANVTMENCEVCGRVDIRKGHALIEGCDVHGGSDGIRVGSHGRLTLKDSRVHDCIAGGDALYVSPQAYANVENCDLYACRVNAVHVKTGHLIMQRSRIRDCLFGICFRERATGLVESSTLEHIEQLGVFISGQSDPVIKSNVMRECGLLCILADAQSGGHVSCNTFDGSIHVRNGSVVKLTANTVSGHADVECSGALVA